MAFSKFIIVYSVHAKRESTSVHTSLGSARYNDECPWNSDEFIIDGFVKAQRLSVETICLPRKTCYHTMRANYKTGDSRHYTVKYCTFDI